MSIAAFNYIASITAIEKKPISVLIAQFSEHISHEENVFFISCFIFCYFWAYIEDLNTKLVFNSSIKAQKWQKMKQEIKKKNIFFMTNVFRKLGYKNRNWPFFSNGSYGRNIIERCNRHLNEMHLWKSVQLVADNKFYNAK